MNKQMDTFSFNPPIDLFSAVTGFEATNPVLNLTDKNNIFSFTPPGYWSGYGSDGTVYGLSRILELRSKNEIELHVNEVRERGNELKTAEKEYDLSDLILLN